MNSDSDNFIVLEKKILYQGFANMVRYKIAHKLFSGEWSKPYFREICERYNAVALLPYDPILDRVVSVKQFRTGALKDKNEPWLLELIAGVIDKDKTLEEIAVMEAEEEAGLKINKLIPVYEFWSSPGGTSEYVSLFCAIIDASQTAGIYGLKDENEDIMALTMSCDEAFAAVKSGAINNASTIIALQWLQINRKTVIDSL